MVPDALPCEVPEMMDTPPILCSYRKPQRGAFVLLKDRPARSFFFISLQSFPFYVIIISTTKRRAHHVFTHSTYDSQHLEQR